MFVSRDVHFEEEIFPFKQHDFTKQNPSTSILPQFLPVYTESTEFLESEVSFPAQSLHPSITPISSFLIQEQQPIFTSATNNTPHTYDLQPQEPSSKTSSTNHSSPLRRTTGTVKPLSWLKTLLVLHLFLPLSQGLPIFCIPYFNHQI